MNRLIVNLSLITVFTSAIFLAGQFPAHLDSFKPNKSRPPVADVTYRSRTAMHKVVVYAHEQELRNTILSSGGTLVEDYGAFALYRAPQEAAEHLAAADTTSSVRDDMNLVLLRAGAFDTTDAEPQQLRVEGGAEAADEQLYVVQMVGPVKHEWLEALRQSVDLVSYIPNNAYLVRATASGFARIRELSAAHESFIQWSGDYKPAYKIAPEISLNAGQAISATVQFARSKGSEEQRQKLAAISSVVIFDEPASAEGYTNLRITVDSRQIAEIARLSDVVWIEPFKTPIAFDERQNQIVAGALVNSQLSGPGYLAWLRVKGLASTPDFIVDVADSGMDQGVLDPAVIHKDFLNQAGLNRVIYSRLVAGDGIEGTSQDTTGHGTLNSSIIGGYNTGTSFPMIDGNGFSYGLGIHPFVKLGTTKIFNPEFTSPNYITMTDDMYRDGARISSNSWGSYSNAYNADCQTYDSMVRDARRGEAGNQELTIVFAAGNNGPIGELASPGTAKNIITVGASENLRPGLDACQVATEGADDINSLIDFSSGGPTLDGRTKPDICAPGTHIQGAKSQDRGYNASGVCNSFFPGGQSLYTWSSGTSHAAPAVAGGAALVRQYFQQSTGRAPSPAMVKAYLTNSSSYMTGFLAGDTLPGKHQGLGLLNLGRAFDDSTRILIDQTQTLTDSGQTFAAKGRIISTGKPVRVTLSWTDVPGIPSANPAVNDLDLQLTINGQTYIGNHFSGANSITGGTPDRVNNLESIWLPAGVSGDYEIRVIAANITGDGVPGNSDTSDQDFALVAYNTQLAGSSGDGTPIDASPIVIMKYPVGGEKLTVGNLVRLTWEASDDKAIISQRVEFSSNNGVSYDVIASLNGNERFFDWKIPSLPTTGGRIRVTALDGVNLPSAGTSPESFQIEVGPPDTSAPTLNIVSPTGDTEIGGGTKISIKWREGDNVGVIRRLLEYSGDNGNSFQEMVELVAPSSGELQEFIWEVPVALSTANGGRIRISVTDGAGNSISKVSTGRFTVWPLPIITDAVYVPAASADAKDSIDIFGRNLRKGNTEVYVDGILLKKIKFTDKCDEDGRCKKITSLDKKVKNRFPEGQFVNIQLKIASTGQASPTFEYKRKRPRT
jgi:subtilisin family serine protease